MESEILDLWAGSGTTVVFVTHDLEEAIALSTQVFLLSAGPGKPARRPVSPSTCRGPDILIDIKADAALPPAVPDDLERPSRKRC